MHYNNIAVEQAAMEHQQALKEEFHDAFSGLETWRRNSENFPELIPNATAPIKPMHAWHGVKSG